MRTFLGTALAAGVAVLAACATTPPPPAPPPPPPPPPGAASDSVYVIPASGRVYTTRETLSLARLAYLPCSPSRPEDQSATIGPSGGSLRLAAGHVLEVPAGAVSANSDFRLRQAGGLRHLMVSATSTEPLADSVRLTLSYAACGMPDPTRLNLVQVGEGGPGEDPPDAVNSGAKTITATLGHLSMYAVAQ